MEYTAMDYKECTKQEWAKPQEFLLNMNGLDRNEVDKSGVDSNELDRNVLDIVAEKQKKISGIDITVYKNFLSFFSVVVVP